MYQQLGTTAALSSSPIFVEKLAFQSTVEHSHMKMSKGDQNLYNCFIELALQVVSGGESGFQTLEVPLEFRA